MKPYIVTFPGAKNHIAGKFVVVAEHGKAAIDIAWDSTTSEFQTTHEKGAAQVKEFKRGALRIL
jgi:hypothetical protein